MYERHEQDERSAIDRGDRVPSTKALMCHKHFFNKDLFPMITGASEIVSEQTNERSGACERSKQCGACK